MEYAPWPFNAIHHYLKRQWQKKTAPSHRAWNSARTAWADLHPDTWPVTPPAQRSGKGRRMITRPDREVEPEKQTWIAHLTLKTWWRLSCFGCQNSRWCFNDRSQWKQEREKNKNQTASNCIYPSWSGENGLEHQKKTWSSSLWVKHVLQKSSPFIHTRVYNQYNYIYILHLYIYI